MKGILRQALSQIARDGLECVDPTAVETAARAIWHTDDIVDLGALTGEHRDDAIRLVARLAVFSTVDGGRKSALFAQAREALGVRSEQLVLDDDRMAHAFMEQFWSRLEPLQRRKTSRVVPTASKKRIRNPFKRLR